MAKTKDRPEPEQSIIEEAEAKGVSWADVMIAKKPNRTSVQVVLDSELADEYKAAKQRAETAEMLAGLPDATDETVAASVDAQEAFLEVDSRARLASVEVKMRAIGSNELRALEEDWPATPQQLRAHREKLKAMGIPPQQTVLSQNEDEFFPRLLAATVVDPKMTIEEAKEMRESPDWSAGDLDQLYIAARTVNQLF